VLAVGQSPHAQPKDLTALGLSADIAPHFLEGFFDWQTRSLHDGQRMPLQRAVSLPSRTALLRYGAVGCVPGALTIGLVALPLTHVLWAPGSGGGPNTVIPIGPHLARTQRQRRLRLSNKRQQAQQQEAGQRAHALVFLMPRHIPLSAGDHDDAICRNLHLEFDQLTTGL